MTLRLPTYGFIGLSALIVTLLSTAPALAQNQWIIVDGQPVQVAPEAKRIYSTGANGARPQYHGLEKPLPKLPEIISPGSITDTAIYLLDHKRNMAAREVAERQIIEEMQRTNSNFGVGGTTTDAPSPKYVKPSDAIAKGDQWSRNYEAIKPTAGNDVFSLLDQVFSTTPTIRQFGQEDSPTRRYPQSILFGERRPDGTIGVRLLDEQDGIRYQEQAANKYAVEAEQRARQAAREAEDARNAAQRAREQAERESDEAKRKEEQARRDEAERKAKVAEEERKKAEDEAKRKKEAAEEFRRLAADRDASCRLGGADCAYSNSRLNLFIETSEKAGRTARCVQFDEGHPAPAGGPCAQDAPPCIYCSRVDSMNKERLLADRVSRAVANRISQ